MRTTLGRATSVTNTHAEVQRQLKTIGTTEWIAADKEVQLADEKGQSYFYIILQGFVKEYEIDGETERARGFFFEDDFLSSFSRSDSHSKSFFRSMEVLKVCKMYWSDWKQVQNHCPTMNTYWAKMIEDRVNGNVNWMDLYRTLPTDEFINRLMQKKSQALKNDRLVKIIRVLQSG